MRSEVAKYGDWDPRIVSAIAEAENRTCNPLKHNLSATETHKRADGSVICVGSYGVLQVGCLHYGPNDNPDDMATNIRLAHNVYTSRAKWDTSGYNAWTQYTNGTWREFVK